MKKRYYTKSITILCIIVMVLSACRSNNADISSTVEVNKIETETRIEKNNISISNAEKNKIYFNVEAMAVDGNILNEIQDVEYSVNKLIPVVYYEQSDVKLYAYEREDIDYKTYNLLLEHDGNYQLFSENNNICFDNLFFNSDDAFCRDFEHGVEQKINNKSNLLRIIVNGFGTEMKDTKIIVFSFNNITEKYDLYYIGQEDFKSLTDEAAGAFFKNHYGVYNVNEYGKYQFENGYNISYGQYADAKIIEDGSFEMSIMVFGNPRDDGGMGYEIGQIVFRICYIDGGRFLVKADHYEEWINIMNVDLE